MQFERRISYGKWAKILAVEGFRVPKQTVWATIQKYKPPGAISRLPGSGLQWARENLHNSFEDVL